MILFLILWFIIGITEILTYITFLIFVYLIFVNISKRLHDINKSAWIWVIVLVSMEFSAKLWASNISIVPIKQFFMFIWLPEGFTSILTNIFQIIAVVIVLILLFKKWDSWENNYGWDPLLSSTNNISDNEKNKVISEYLEKQKLDKNNNI